MIATEQETLQLLSTDSKAQNEGFFGDFKVEGTKLGAGSRWRITIIGQTAGTKHEFFVQEGEIYHVQFHTPAPWNHLTQFVIGCRVKRILDSEKRAIFDAIAGW
jgi:hypothetical protein